MASGCELLISVLLLSIICSPSIGQGDLLVTGQQSIGIRCYTGLKTTGGGLDEDARNVTQCDPDYSCVSASAKVFHGMEEVNIGIGRCIPSLICRNYTCGHILSFLPDNADVLDCNISCCNEDLCNKPKIQMPAPTTTEEGQQSIGIRCYTGLKTTGGGLDEDARNVTQCDPDYSCVSASAKVFHGMEEVNIGIGRCIPSLICRNYTCGHILSFLPDNADVLDCNISCCNEDLCNKPKIQMPAPTTTEEVSCPWTGWTSWFNNDHDAEDGDDETIESLRNRYPGDICSRPTGFQARSAATRDPYDPTAINILANVDSGLECLGFPDLPCEDHEIRFCCPEELPPSATASTTSTSTESSTNTSTSTESSTTTSTSAESSTTTEKTTSCPSNGWTGWFNNDRDVHDGDDETIQSIQANNPGLLCDQPTDFQARSARTQEPYDPNIFNIFSGVDLGLECLSFPTLQCEDYEIRFCCPSAVSSTTQTSSTTTIHSIPTTPETTVAAGVESTTIPAATTQSSSVQQQSTPSTDLCPPYSWTSWFNNDINMEDGDDETLQSLQARYPEIICDKPTTFEARSVRTRRPYDESAFNVFAGVDLGLECLAFPSLPCVDHEIRFCCPRAVSSTTQTSSTTTIHSIPTTPETTAPSSSTTSSSSTKELIVVKTTSLEQVTFTQTSPATMTTQAEDQTTPQVLTTEASTFRSMAASSPQTEPPTTAQTTESTTLSSPQTTSSQTEATTARSTTTERSTTKQITTGAVTQPLTTTPAGFPFFFYEDLNFLPSCTVSHATTSIFRCERIFASPTPYNGPLTCRNNVEKVIECVRSQIMQCLSGGGENVLDTFGFKLFNSKQFLSLLGNLTLRAEDTHETNINTFCFHAGLNFPYPYPVEARIDGCEDNALDLLLRKTMEAYSKYTWARNRNDICRAFQKFKQWFMETAPASCNFSTLTTRGYNPNSANYLFALTRVVLNTLEGLNSSAC